MTKLDIGDNPITQTISVRGKDHELFCIWPDGMMSWSGDHEKRYPVADLADAMRQFAGYFESLAESGRLYNQDDKQSEEESNGD